MPPVPGAASCCLAAPSHRPYPAPRWTLGPNSPFWRETARVASALTPRPLWPSIGGCGDGTDSGIQPPCPSRPRGHVWRPLLSKALRHALRAHQVEQIHLDAGGRQPRAFGGDGSGFTLPIGPALEAAAHATKPGSGAPEWRSDWIELETRLRHAHGGALAAAPWGDLTVHARLHAALPSQTHLHLANSTPVRYAQLFHDAQRPQPWSNRGVAGIDGCSSTAVGAALAGHRVTLISGDLGFLYDANAFHVHPLPATLRIAVIHNGGGGVFRWLPGPIKTGLLPTHFEMRHGLELRSVCDLHGLEHQRVESMAELEAVLEHWWSESEVPRVMEIATPPEQSAEAHAAYMERVSA